LAKRRWIEEFYRGFLRLAKRFRVAVVGGDTAITVGGIYVDVALIGEATNGRPLLRSCARPGDMIYTSGRLGLSRMGLEALRWKRAAKRGTKRAGPWPGLGADKLALAIAAHLFPEPRIALGQFLARNRLASAAIDVSDGLSTDLAQLAEASGVGARIWANLVPEPWALAPAGVYPGGAGDRRRRRSESGAPARAPLGSANVLRLALDGGEDYELLFTVPPRLAARIPRAYRGVPLPRIGVIERGRGLKIVTFDGRKATLRAGGFDHFTRGRRR